ncbi:uncharacterized protein [Onthophagus taurus]|uniref:uncharacterized protein n=1 Tax=Onthophagus taurus TaxID=166361 RepID=UPI0039BDA5DD
MSGANVACNIGNQMGEGLTLNGAGEVKYHVTSKEEPNLATCICSEVVNDILESALDIATMGDNVAFTMEEGPFPTQLVTQEVAEIAADESSRIKEIVDGLNTIHLPNQNAEEPPRLDVEMKRLLSEMMSSPPYDGANFENVSRKDGVGDQPVDEVKEETASEECLVDSDKIKIVEKKTRVTDLVMNSKQVLSELLMSEETRNKQAEWEESNEMVLQVIELDCIKPEEACKWKHSKKGDKIEDEDEEKVVLTPVTPDECLINIDLNKKSDEEVLKRNEGPDDDSLAGCSFINESEETGKDKMKTKFENLRKKFNLNFKLFNFGKRKQKGREEKNNI